MVNNSNILTVLKIFGIILLLNENFALFELKEVPDDISYLFKPILLRKSERNQFKPNEFVEHLTFRKRRSPNSLWFDRFRPCFITNKELGLDNLRQKRALQISPTNNCEISQQELEDSIKAVKLALVNISTLQQSDNCVKIKSLDNCEELMSELNCAINLIINKFNIADKSQQLIEQLEENYKILKTKYDDNANVIRSTSEKLSQQTDNLNKTLNLISRKLEDCKSFLTKEYEEKRISVIESCILKIGNGEVNEALKILQEFWNLSDPSVSEAIISQLIEKGYDNLWKNNEKFLYTLSFIVELRNRSYQTTALSCLYNKIKQNDDLNNPQIMIVDYFIKRLSIKTNEDSLDDEIRERLKDVKAKFELAVDSLIRYWGYKIRLGQDYSKLISFTSEFSLIFGDHFENIIIAAYNKCIENAEIILKFIDALPDEYSRAIAYPVLFQEMKESNGYDGHELLMLVYRVKQLLDHSYINKLTKIQISKLTSIKSQLPHGVRALLWNSPVHIKSRQHPNNYLMSFAQTCPNIYDSRKSWFVKVLENGRYFKFSDDYLQCNLMCTRTAYLMNVISDNTNSVNDIWEVIPVENGNYLYFKNKVNENVLDANELKGFWGSLISNVPNGCSATRLVRYFTGSNYQQWNIL